MNHFKFGGVSSRKFGLYITGRGVYSAPEREVDRISVPGRDGDVIIDRGRYKNVSLTFPCFFHTSNVGRAARKIKEWLYTESGAYLPLSCSYEPEIYRLAMYTGPTEIDSSVRRFGQIDLTFDCKPWRYLEAGQALQDITQAKQIINPCAFSSVPYIRITGSGNVTMTLGNRSWRLLSVDGYIEMDSELMNTYRDTLPQNSRKIGDGYPLLSPGVNNFAWTGDVSRVEIKPRWRTL